MGLFAGVSIISGIEILFFACKIFAESFGKREKVERKKSLRKNRKLFTASQK